MENKPLVTYEDYLALSKLKEKMTVNLIKRLQEYDIERLEYALNRDSMGLKLGESIELGHYIVEAECELIHDVQEIIRVDQIVSFLGSAEWGQQSQENMEQWYDHLVKGVFDP